MNGMDAVNDLINSGGVPELVDLVAQQGDPAKRKRVEHQINLIFDDAPGNNPAIPSLMDIDYPDRDDRMKGNNNMDGPPPNWNGPWGGGGRGNGPPMNQFHGNPNMRPNMPMGQGPRRGGDRGGGDRNRRDGGGGRWSRR